MITLIVFFLIVCALRKTTNMVHCSLADFENQQVFKDWIRFILSFHVLIGSFTSDRVYAWDKRTNEKYLKTWNLLRSNMTLYCANKFFSWSGEQVGYEQMYFFLKSSLNQTLHQKYVLLIKLNTNSFVVINSVVDFYTIFFHYYQLSSLTAS